MRNHLAIVTGCTRGVGLATATDLLGRGWSVLGVARGAAPDALAASERYEHLAVDLADIAAVESKLGARLARERLVRHDRLALINNAGVLDIQPVHTLDLAAAVRSLTVNAAVPAWITGCLLRNAPRTVAIRIVDVSSGAATKAYTGWSSYCASKAAQRMYGQALEQELGALDAHREADVRIVCYAPGVVATGMQAQIRAADLADFPDRERFQTMHDEGQLAEPSSPAREIADLVESHGLPRWSEARFEG